MRRGSDKGDQSIQELTIWITGQWRYLSSRLQNSWITAKWQYLTSRLQSRLYYTDPDWRARWPRLSHPDPIVAIEDRVWSLSKHIGGVPAILGIRVEKSGNSYKLEVDYKGNAPWSEMEFFEDAFQDASKLTDPLLKDSRVAVVSLARFGDLTDLYGQTKETLGSRITITRAGSRKLKWASTNAESLLLISQSGDTDVQVDLHPAILQNISLE